MSILHVIGEIFEWVGIYHTTHFIWDLLLERLKSWLFHCMNKQDITIEARTRSHDLPIILGSNGWDKRNGHWLCILSNDNIEFNYPSSLTSEYGWKLEINPPRSIIVFAICQALIMIIFRRFITERIIRFKKPFFIDVNRVYSLRRNDGV